MNANYIQLLPTVFVLAEAFPTLQAQQAGLTQVFDADEWNDEPTKPDLVIPRHLLQPASVLPAHVERELADCYEVDSQEMRRLKGWMESRNLRAGFFTKAVDYLAQMRRSAAQEILPEISEDDEPTVRIDIRKVDARKKEARHGFVRPSQL